MKRAKISKKHSLSKTSGAVPPAVFIGGAGLGVGLMYFLDPDVGARRRGRVRDLFVHFTHVLSCGVEKAFRDTGHRVQGLFARTRGLFLTPDISDEALVARVRAELGHRMGHIHALTIDARDGRVVLSGPILVQEAERLVHEVARVRGVKSVVNRLEVYDRPTGIPALQGEWLRLHHEQRRTSEAWPPSTRLGASLLGLGLVGFGATRKGELRTASLAMGAALVVRAMGNARLARIFGLGREKKAVEFRKSMVIHAPVEEVFEFWRRLENFPKFMEHVREVRVLDERRSRWKVAGPAGASVEWETEITKLVPGEVIAWRTLPGAAVEHTGVVQFEKLDHNNATRVDIRMSYRPPVGVIGHAVAALFRSDPKRAMDDDLVRMKSLLEEGKATAHSRQVSLRDLN